MRSSLVIALLLQLQFVQQILCSMYSLEPPHSPCVFYKLLKYSPTTLSVCVHPSSTKAVTLGTPPHTHTLSNLASGPPLCCECEMG